MNVRKYRYFVGDFETTVYKGQVNTEVWASASVELYTEDVNIFHSIGEQFEYFLSLDCNVVCFYHNLKFDGSFWLSYLLVDLGYTQAFERYDEQHGKFFKPKDMPNKSVTYSISSTGQWYNIFIKTHGHIIELRDSLKILPFSVKKIGKSFGTKHKKLDMKYEGFRYAGCEISPEEQLYISNDILVVKEAIEIMFNEGHKKITIGSNCLAEYKKSIGGNNYDRLFPDLYQYEIDESIYGYTNAGEYIKQSYRGGWCYLARGKEGKIFNNGTTADVNSLYPSMMSSGSGNMYPIGYPTFWSGDYIPSEALQYNKFYFVRFITRFYIYPNKLPFIQVKNTLAYKANEMLETSDMYNKADGCWYTEYIGFDGKVKSTAVTMTMTQTDFKLFKEHYELVDFKILDGCYFDSTLGLFDKYIDKYKEMKMNSTGARRELAKLFLNNLYGKMASSPCSNFKVAYIKEDKSLGFETMYANDKKAGYIPVGSAITSYARNFTIRAAQQNYYGSKSRGFIYADTDSIHCDLSPEELRGLRVDDKDFCCWKLESCWDVGYFVRQKTYIEHVVSENCEPINAPYYNVKCAGMPDRCKELFLLAMEGYVPQEGEEFNEREIEFLQTKRTLVDFNVGLRVPSKLLPKRIRGGVLLTDSYYEMR